MLSRQILKNSDQAAHYYEKDDYYTKDKSEVAPSKWWGRGAERLGLDEKPVDRRVFQEALSGRGPGGHAIRERGDRVGVDLTFSAPKSVSLEALVHGRRDVARAHEAAVSVALRYLEDEGGAQARMTVNGTTFPVETKNLLVARFNHDTSRALDPQLHTHAVVLNATERPDGEWRALHNDGLFAKGTILAAGALYRAELADRLKSMGYGLRMTGKEGLFELEGFSPEVLERFSQRTQAIQARLEELGRTDMWAAQRAKLETREAKRDVDRETLRGVWTKAASELGLASPVARKERTGCNRTGERSVEKAENEQSAAQAIVKAALLHLTERSTVVSERDLMGQAMVRSVGRVRPDEVRSAWRELEVLGELLPSEASEQAPLLRRYTTLDAVKTERRFLSSERRRRGRHQPIVAPEDLDRELERRPDREREGPYLTDGQKDAVRIALASRDGVVGVQGYAGTGKTTMLEQLRRRAEEAGYIVRGYAPSGAAVKALRDEAGVVSSTVADHLMRVRRVARTPGEAKTLWIVDEASMVGNRDTADLLFHAERLGARVLLVGDRQQLPSIEAGRAFALLQDRGMRTATMDEIQRQKNTELLQAVKDVIQKKPERALERLEKQIEEISDRTERIDHIAKTYLALSPSERERTLVVTPSNEDRVALNARIREGLRGVGQLRGEEVEVAVLVAKNLTAAETKEARNYAIGDVVRFNQAYRRGLEVEAGEYLQVRSVDVEGNALDLERRGGGRGDGLRWVVHKDATGKGSVEVYRPELRTIAEGDVLKLTRNDRASGRVNGAIVRVKDISPSEGSMTIDEKGGGRRVERVEPVNRVERVNREERMEWTERIDLRKPLHLEHAYASTVHASQGKTVDRVIVHLDTARGQLMGHESFYVAISRGRHEVHLVTDDRARLPLTIQRTMGQEAAVDVVMGRESAPKRVSVVERPRLPELPVMPCVPGLDRWADFEDRPGTR